MSDQQTTETGWREPVFLILVGGLFLVGVIIQANWLMWLGGGTFIFGLLWLIVMSSPNDGRKDGGAGIGPAFGGDGGCGGGDGGGGGC